MKTKRKLSEAQQRVLAEHRWRPGESGNPGGSSTRQRLRTCYLRMLDQRYPKDRNQTWAEAITRALFEAAVEGAVGAIREIADRTGGKPTLNVDAEFSQSGGGLRLSDFDNMSPAEIQNFIDGCTAVIEGHAHRGNGAAEHEGKS